MKSPCFDFPGLQVFRDYQIVQEAPDLVTVHVVPGRDRGPFPRCARLGARFDPHAFHDAVLAGGSVTLPVLRARVREWSAAR